jgi:GT2 family glycosyltransferase
MTLQNEKNLGYTKTVNRGLEFAFKTADTVIVANDDLEFRKGDLDKFRIIDDGIYYPSDSASGDSKCFGAIWGMNKRTYQRLGKLNENYKHFFSDRDYYQKAIKAGLPVVNWPEIIIKHHESATYNLINKKELLQEDEKTFKRNVI